MTLDISLAKNILESDIKQFDLVLDSGVDKFLIGDGKEIFEFISKYYSKHGVIPNKDVVKTELGGLLLNTIENSVPYPTTYIIEKIKKRSLSVHLEDGIKSIVDDLKGDSPEEALTKLKHIIHKAGSLNLDEGKGVNLTKDVKERLEDYLRIQQLGDGIDGWRTPWPTMDKVTQGYHPGDVSWFIGRTNMGKTWTLLYNIVPAIYQKANILVISMEMNALNIGRRLDSLVGKFKYNDLRKGQLSSMDFDRYTQQLTIDYQEFGDIYCYGPPRVRTVADVELLVERHKPDILFIDGVYLLGGGGVTDRYLKVQHAAEELKYMSEGKKVATIGTIQFTKAGTAGNKKNKMDADLEDTGYSYGLAHIATNVFGLFQSEDFKANKHLLINFLKVREAEKSKGFVVNWDFDTMNFNEIGLWDGDSIIETDANGNPVKQEIPVEIPTDVAF